MTPTHNCILIIDDSLSIRNLLKRDISEAMPLATIIVAADGKDAIHQMTQHSFDIIISDLEMPNMDGNQFAEKIKNNPLLRRKKIILFTSKPEDISKIVQNQDGIFIVDKNQKAAVTKIVELVKTLL